jgi:hypothetical protein
VESSNGKTVRAKSVVPVQLQEFSTGVLKVGSALAMRYDADLFAIHVRRLAGAVAGDRVWGIDG